VLVAPSGHLTITVPTWIFTSTVGLELWETPPKADPSRNSSWRGNTRSIGRSFWLRKTAGDAILQGGYAVEVTYVPTDTVHLQESELRLFRWNETDRVWQDSYWGIDTNQHRFYNSWISVLGYFDLQTYAVCDGNEVNDSVLAARTVTTDNAPYYTSSMSQAIRIGSASRH
jgi:hypothetical protein